MVGRWWFCWVYFLFCCVVLCWILVDVVGWRNWLKSGSVGWLDWGEVVGNFGCVEGEGMVGFCKIIEVYLLFVVGLGN